MRSEVLKIIGFTILFCLCLSPIVTGIAARSTFDLISSNASGVITLTSPNVQTNGFFGQALATSGKYLIASAAHEGVGGQSEAGNVYVYDVKTGTLLVSISSPNYQTDGQFGDDVSFVGGNIAIGAGGESVSGLSEAGRAYTFTTSGTLVDSFTSPDAQTGGNFGQSVAISSTGTVIVGAPREAAYGLSEAGHAYIFDVSKGVIGKVLTLTSPNAQTDGLFGFSVATMGSYVIIGAEGESSAGQSDAGNVYVFNANSGDLIATISSPSPQTGGTFGNSLAVGGTSKTPLLVVGAPWQSVDSYSRAGNAYVFNLATEALLHSLSSPAPQTGGRFGDGVSITANMIAVGADYETSHGQSIGGNAYTFSESAGSLENTFTSPNAQADGYFGFDIVIYSGSVIVGAEGETALGQANAGHVYIF